MFTDDFGYGGEGGIETPVGEWEVRGRRALVCLLLSTSVFDLNESPVFKRVPEGAKSTGSSSKNSSTEAR